MIRQKTFMFTNDNDIGIAVVLDTHDNQPVIQFYDQRVGETRHGQLIGQYLAQSIESVRNGLIINQYKRHYDVSQYYIDQIVSLFKDDVRRQHQISNLVTELNL